MKSITTPKVLTTALLLAMIVTTPARADQPATADSGFAPDNPLACTGTLNQVPVPYPANSAVQPPGLFDTAAAAGNKDVWFAGVSFEGNNLLEIDHFDGNRLAAVPHPQIGADFGVSGLSFSSPDDGWVFYNYLMNEESFISPGAGTFLPLEPLADHWDGTRWTTVPVAIPSDTAAQPPFALDGGLSLTAIADLASDDAWAVGATGHQGGDVDASGFRAVIEHWDGAQWRIVPAPARALPNSILYSVSATSAKDVWAAGRYIPDDGVERSLVEHWNGRTWSITPSPDPAGSPAAELSSVSADSPTDAWAVGQYSPGPQQIVRGLVKHWDGQTWTDVSDDFPPGGAFAVRLSSAVARGPRDVFVISTSDVAVSHWNGDEWAPVQVAADPGAPVASALAAEPDGAIWAAGYDASFDALEQQPVVPKLRAFRLCGPL